MRSTNPAVEASGSQSPPHATHLPQPFALNLTTPIRTHFFPPDKHRQHKTPVSPEISSGLRVYHEVGSRCQRSKTIVNFQRARHRYPSPRGEVLGASSPGGDSQEDATEPSILTGLSDGACDQWPWSSAPRPPSASTPKPRALGICLVPLPWPSSFSFTGFVADNN